LYRKVKGIIGRLRPKVKGREQIFTEREVLSQYAQEQHKKSEEKLFSKKK
jgi:hypothetical protein